MIDPKIFSMLVQASGDKETRQKAVISLITALSVFLILFAAIQYILSHPIELLADQLTGDLQTVEEFKNSYDYLLNPVESDPDQIDGAPIILPMKKIQLITSEFGERGGTVHHGIDLVGDRHANVMSVLPGTVVIANTNENDGLGNYVIIRHEDEEHGLFYTVYGHLSVISVRSGQEVAVGSVIEKEGVDPELDPNPGASTGHHLHFEIRIGSIAQSAAVDPYSWLYGDPEEATESEELTEIVESENTKNLMKERNRNV